MSEEITKAEWLIEYEKIQQDEDEILYHKAVDFTIKIKNASMKLLAAGIGISDHKARSLMAKMEVDGIIGSYRAGRPRKVLLKRKEK